MATKRSTVSRRVGGGNRQDPSSISANTIFLACNFNNKRVKGHFTRLKRKWEKTYPLRVYLSDQVKGKGARDLWKDICKNVEESRLAVFDVTSFRPNVVLELGYCLASKHEEHIVICRDLTPSGKKTKRQEKWVLSDIPHLSRVEYRKFSELDYVLLDHVHKMEPVGNMASLIREIERRKDLPYKTYIRVTFSAVHLLRDSGPMRRTSFRSFLRDREVDARIIEKLLRKYGLATPDSGKDGYWRLID